jgi:hypothetical protein
MPREQGEKFLTGISGRAENGGAKRFVIHLLLHNYTFGAGSAQVLAPAC